MFNIRVNYWEQLYQYLKSEILWPMNQLIRSKLRLLWFVHMHNVNENKERYYRIEHAGHKSKSGQPVRPYSTSGTLIDLFFQQTCQNIARINSISLVHWMHGWTIPAVNRMV